MPSHHKRDMVAARVSWRLGDRGRRLAGVFRVAAENRATMSLTHRCHQPARRLPGPYRWEFEKDGEAVEVDVTGQ